MFWRIVRLCPGVVIGYFSLNKWIVVALLCLANIIAYVDRTNLSVAIASKEFIDFFHLTDIQRGDLSSAFFWSYAFLQVPIGALTDRFGSSNVVDADCTWCEAARNHHQYPIRMMPLFWPSSLMFLGTPDIFAAPESVALSIALNMAIYVALGSLFWRMGTSEATQAKR